MASLQWWLNFATFAGIAALAIPVWDLNARKRRLHDIRQADSEATSDNDFRERTRQILFEKQRQDVEGWRRRDQVCLAIGYVLLLGAAFLRLVFAPG